MNILIVPEDPRNDQYILKPLFERLFRQVIGNQTAKVRICQNPVLGGVNAALRSERIAEIVERYDGMTDIFILCIDRDGRQGRRRRLDEIEADFGNDRTFFAENAWEELETWVLAGLNLPPSWRWAEVRAAVDVKEIYFDQLAKDRGIADGPGGGRKRLGEEAASRIPAIRRKCPEDFDVLARKLKSATQSVE